MKFAYKLIPARLKKYSGRGGYLTTLLYYSWQNEWVRPSLQFGWNERTDADGRTSNLHDQITRWMMGGKEGGGREFATHIKRKCVD